MEDGTRYFGTLPEEMIEHILLRLSVKDLSVCKCVCLGWCNHIKSPSFVDRHFKHESNQDCLVFRIHNYVVFEEKYQYEYAMYNPLMPSLLEKVEHLPLMPTGHKADEILGPENGIFYLTSRLITSRTRAGLLNPALREFKMLPAHPLHHDLVIAKPLIGFGLVTSETSRDFKVVALLQSSLQNFAYVYNLSSDSWKTIEAVSDAFDAGGAVNSCRILEDGFKHWLVKFANRDSYSILAFDMEDEKFEEMPIPNSLRNTETGLQLTEYGDSRALMSFKWNTSLDFWEMKRDGSWSKIFKLKPFEEDLCLLTVWRKNELFIWSLHAPLIMADISTMEVRILITDTGLQNVSDCFTYKESLVSIKGEGADSIEDL